MSPLLSTNWQDGEKALMRRLSEVSSYGKLMFLVGLLIATPLMVLPFYPQESGYIYAFLIPSSISLLLGLLVCIFSPQSGKPATQWQSPLRQGSLPVLFIWCFAFVTGALPFVLGRQLSFILALFESISGWTTVGLSVSDVTALPRIFLFHRAFMQYCGGLGFVIMIAMVIRGRQNMILYSAEGHTDRILPSLTKTSQAIFLLYSCFLLLGTLAYRISGMGLFDSICHTMSALSTAGFTTKVQSIGQYASLPIELITVMLMLVGSTNFAVQLLLVKGRFRQVAQVSEIRFMLGLMLVFVTMVTLALMRSMGLGIAGSLRQALFGVVSTFTTTGYSTMDYASWPPFAVGLLILLMIVGGSVGSTAGGIKLLRTYLLIRIARENIRSRLSATSQVTMPSYHSAQGVVSIDTALIKDTYGFVSCYMAVYIIGTLLLTLTSGCSLQDAMYEFASALGTVGISNGLTSAYASMGTLIVLMLGMILGRLEVFIVFIGAYAGIQILSQKVRYIR